MNVSATTEERFPNVLVSFDILLTVHLNIFIIILTNLMP